MRPAVEPGYGLFVERCVGPIDNPARPPTVAPYRAHNTSSESNWGTHACVLPFTHKTNRTQSVPQPKLCSRRVPRLCMVTFNSHLKHTIENRIAKAYSTLMISITYPVPRSMPRSVTLANPKNKGKSYTTFLKPIVSAEWLRQIRLKYSQAPTGNVSSRLHAHFLLHHLSFCNNLYKLPPYLTMCEQRNPMSLLRLRSQSHESIPTHMLNIDDNQRDTYDS